MKEEIKNTFGFHASKATLWRLTHKMEKEGLLVKKGNVFQVSDDGRDCVKTFFIILSEWEQAAIIRRYTRRKLVVMSGKRKRKPDHLSVVCADEESK